VKDRILNVQQGSPEWHAARANRITASEIYDVLRNHDRAVRQQVEKRLDRVSFKGNAATEYGTQAEPVAIEDFATRFLVTVEQPGFVVSATRPEQFGCSPDGVFPHWETGEPTLLQVKCPYSKDIPTYPPRRYLDQVNWEMGICRIPQVVVWYWTPEGAVDFWIDFDEALFADQEAAALKVLARVEEIMAGDPGAWLDSQGAPVAFRDDAAWREAEVNASIAKNALEAAQAAYDDAKEELIKLSGGQPGEGELLRVVWQERKGTVAWPKLVKKFGIPAAKVEQYRDPPTRYAKVERVKL
jgi:hypothetical protein